MFGVKTKYDNEVPSSLDFSPINGKKKKKTNVDDEEYITVKAHIRRRRK